MNLTFLGVGSAFTKSNGQSCVLVESNESKMLIDCGTTAPSGLNDVGVSLNEITDIFISHLHNDHIGGLEEVAIMDRMVFKRRTTLVSTQSLLQRLWTHSLQGGLEFMEVTPGDMTPQTLEDFFDQFHVTTQDWAPINNSFIEIKIVKTNHVLGMETYGLYIRDVVSKKKILFTGDTRLDIPMLEEAADSCDMIFHDCQLFDSGPDNKLGVHVSYNQLNKLPSRIKEKIWIYHYGDTELPTAIEDGFLGFIQKSQRFEF